MQSYASAQQPTPSGRLQSVRPTRRASAPQALASTAPTDALIDQLLSQLADLVVDRLMARTGTETDEAPAEWMDARAAAVYLGVHRDTLRKLAAEGSVPVHQDGPGCKLYFAATSLTTGADPVGRRRAS